MNTLTVNDLHSVAASPYSWSNAQWAVGRGKNDPVDPIAAYGIEGVRTSRRAEGFGDLAGILDADILGIPVWLIGAGVAAVVLLPKLMK